MSISNLPDFPGAATVYARVNRINIIRAADQYETWCHVKYRRKSYKFSVSEDIMDAINAMNVGDEEALKAYVAKYLDIAVPPK